MRPPRLAAALLRYAVPESCRGFVELDLEEEFLSYQLGERGFAGARAWYWRQVFLSIRPLLAQAMRGANWEFCFLAVFLATAGQIVAVDLLWSLILSQVPLKMDVARGVGYIAGSLALTTFAAWIAGTLLTYRGLALAIPAAGVFTMLGWSAMRGVTPGWFGLGLVGLATLGLTAGSKWRQAESYSRYVFENRFARFMTPVVLVFAKKKAASDLAHLRQLVEAGH